MKERLDALTGLRFFAALLIVFHHLPGHLWFQADAPVWFNSKSGVSFFFILSGFILHYNYRDRIERISTWRFYVLRYLRLWPAHLAALGLTLFLLPRWWLTWLPAKLSIIEIVSHIFMFQWVFPAERVYFAWNGVSWSIATEFAFYLAFPFLCVHMARRPVATLFSVAAIVATYLAFAKAFLFDPSIPGNLTGLVYISPFARILEFSAGILTCEIAMFRRRLASRGKWLEWAALSLVIAGLCLSKSIVPPGGDDNFFLRYLSIVSLTPVFCLFIAVVGHGRGAVSSFLATPPLVWLGNISFALYLVHQPIIGFFELNLSELLWWQQVPLFAFACVGLSALIFRWVEMPTHEAARRRLSGARRAVLEPGFGGPTAAP